MNDLSVCMFSVLYIIWDACKLLPPDIEIKMDLFSFLAGLVCSYICITESTMSVLLLD